MTKLHQNSLKGLAVSASVLALVSAAPAWAQAADEIECPAGQEEVDGECVIQSDGPDGVTSNDPTAQDVVDVTDTGALGGQESGAIVVTGSRIKRDTYSSISPLQVLTSDTENEAGLFDPSQILQRSESASGQQIDATFQGFVLDNGPGSQTLNLRGLGADRTLLLVNGRRLAPAGVEGAPTNPSINLLPGSLIDRYDLLLDGASSIYGSDAVAGVGNIILRKDFDGLELFARGDINPQGSGEDYTISAAYGLNTDRGFIGIGAEYDYRDVIRLRDRDFFQGCATNLEFTQDGEIRTTDIASNAIVNARTPGVSVVEQDCVITSQVGRIIVPGTYFGNLFFQPGIENSGVPGFSAFRDAFGQDVDSDGDGFRDVDFPNGFNRNGADDTEVFLSEQKLYNVMAYGEYTFAGAGNITPYFEANYSRAEIFSDNTGAAQVFPNVPASNPFNPCNLANPNGVDCRLANNQFEGFAPGTVNALPTGTSRAVQPILSIQGDRDNTDVVQEQYRGVFGIKGDLPFIGSSWTFDTSFVYSRSEGSSVRRGIREDKLIFALGLDPTADFTGDGVFDNDGDGIADDYNNGVTALLPGGACNAAGLRNPGAALPDLAQGCVPVNLFAPSVLGSPIGSFASQAEADYLFGVRSFDTTYEQMVFSGFVTGDLFELPAGMVGAVFGAEYRKDKIDSQPDAIASNGLFYGFFADQGAQGSKDIKEAFAEIDIPLEANKPWVRELNLNVSGRVTDEEFYGTNFTYAIKGGWRPIDSLLLKMSYGTSFRAPNLRENFLAGQTGFQTLLDPCAVPIDAFDGLNGGYNAADDTRDQDLLDSCRREGRDPTTVGLDPQSPTLPPQQLSSTEIASGGSLDIEPETSRSITAGFAFEETFGDGYDISLGASYFDIKLKDSIVEPSPQFIINDCFALRDPESRSPFCDRITYDPNGRMLVTDVSAGFLNLNQESVRGIDFNGTFGKEVALFGTLVDLGLNVRANHLIERSNLFIGDDGVETFDEDAGDFGLPKWTGRATLTADIDKFRLTWQTRYTGRVELDEDLQDEFSDAFGNRPDGQPITPTTPAPNAVANTCTGAGSANGVVPGDGVFCRDVDFADEQFIHTASVRYRTDRFTLLVGVDNIFNTAPPLVDPTEVLSIANTAIGNGYDYDGREFFASVEFEF
jgi:iron complex outermembrane receptor protein